MWNLYSHKRLVIAANLLQMNVKLSVDVRLQHTVALRLRAGRTDEQTGGVLKGALVLEASGGRAAMAVARLQHARILLPGELYVATRRLISDNKHILRLSFFIIIEIFDIGFKQCSILYFWNRSFVLFITQSSP